MYWTRTSDFVRLSWTVPFAYLLAFSRIHEPSPTPYHDLPTPMPWSAAPHTRATSAPNASQPSPRSCGTPAVCAIRRYSFDGWLLWGDKLWVASAGLQPQFGSRNPWHFNSNGLYRKVTIRGAICSVLTSIKSSGEMYNQMIFVWWVIIVWWQLVELFLHFCNISSAVANHVILQNIITVIFQLIINSAEKQQHVKLFVRCWHQSNKPVKCRFRRCAFDGWWTILWDNKTRRCFLFTIPVHQSQTQL